MYPSMDELHQAIAGVLRLDGNTPSITNEQRLRETRIDQFVFTAVFATDPEVKTQGRSTIRQLAEVTLDFSVLEQTGRIVRDRYHLGGVVQHGTSTLLIEVFDQFPRHHALEIQLATGFQNSIYDQMPAELRQRIYQWVEQHLHDEWKQEALTLISNHATPRSLNPNLFVSDVYFARRDREDSLR